MTIPRIEAPRRSRFAAAALLLPLAFAAATARAVDADPLHSSECRGAIASMQTEEAAEARRHANDATPRAALPVASPSLQEARRQAARVCLASRADVDPPHGRFAQAPIVVAPVGPIAPVARAAGPPAVAPADPHGLPMPASPKRPDAVVSCDSGGCWANDGSRLQRVGPVLWGPRGACAVQGASLQCP